MNTIALYFIEIATTLAICCAVVVYLRRSLRRVLVDLCRTEERAQFWLVFASILLVGLPLIFGMGFNPSAADAEKAFFEAANQIKWNLLGFLTTLIGIGFVISFFALVAPRPAENKNTGV
jgi:uncharacterized membrane protein (DUF4010 family)